MCNFEKCDFVVWTPMSLTPIYDKNLLQNFYIQNILTEVLTRKIENSAPKIFDEQKDKLYCFCNSPYSSHETWISCDSEK